MERVAIEFKKADAFKELPHGNCILGVYGSLTGNYSCLEVRFGEVCGGVALAGIDRQ